LDTTPYSLHPWWSGSKLVEQLHNKGVKPLFALLLSSRGLVHGWHKVNQQWGTWAGDRVVIVGEYSDDLPPFLTPEEETELRAAKMNLYFFAKEHYQELENEDVFEGADALSFRTDHHHVLANMDTKEYWILQPLATHPRS
jgi:hypothetical protein